jgi:hypothetical protein
MPADTVVLSEWPVIPKLTVCFPGPCRPVTRRSAESLQIQNESLRGNLGPPPRAKNNGILIFSAICGAASEKSCYGRAEESA